MTSVPEYIVREARRDPWLRGRVHLCSTRREPLYLDGEVVGFVTPHLDARGRWRHGPIYIIPAARGRGVLRRYYAAHPERECVAFVHRRNTASRRAHEAAGFRPLWSTPHGTYLLRPPVTT